MKKLLSSPEVIAALITVFGTLLVGIILGVAEGKIGFMSLLAVVAALALFLLLYLLFKRSGPKVTAAAALIMLVVGFGGFSLFGRHPTPEPAPTPVPTTPPAAVVVQLPSATPVTVAPTAAPQPTATSVVAATAGQPPTRTAIPVPTAPPPTKPAITPAPLPTMAPGQAVAVPDAKIGVIIPPGPGPAAIAVAGDTLWVADNQDHRLYQMDGAGGTVSSFAISNQDTVYGLAWDGQDLLLALGGWDRCRLARMSTAGSVLASVSLPVNPVGLGWNAEDATLWTSVLEQGLTFFVHLTPEGRLVETVRADVFGGPDGLTCAPDGLWVTTAFGDAARFSYSGARLAQSSTDLGTFPQLSPAMGADGTLFLASESNRRIYQFSTRLDAARADPTPLPDERGARYLPRPAIEQLAAGGSPSVRFQNGFAGPLTVALDRINYSDHEAAVIQPGDTWTVAVEPGAYTLFASTSGQGMVTLWGRELLVKGYAFTWRVEPEQ